MAQQKLRDLQNNFRTLQCYPPEIFTETKNPEIKFTYQLSGDKKKLTFVTRHVLPDCKIEFNPTIEKIIALLNVVEGFSYWKLACPKEIHLNSVFLDELELGFLKKLMINGFGEFFFKNKLPIQEDVVFISEKDTKISTQDKCRKELKGSLVLVGGGKDSIVSLELMKNLNVENNYFPIVPFSVNPLISSKQAIEKSELGPPIYYERILDSQLINLNSTGEYYNGHVPFSSILALISVLVAYVNNLKSVIVSNESSSNEGNVKIGDFVVNHQYSKSYEFEKDFSKILDHSKIPVNYFSLLRPLNEIQITKIFSTIPQYHSIFQSCNVKQTKVERDKIVSQSVYKASDKWCANCSKCTFVYLMLKLFLSADKLIKIFGTSVEDSPNFKKYTEELSGQTEHKPFECVGTFEEVRFALSSKTLNSELNKDTLDKFLKHWDLNNQLDDECKKLLKNALAIL